MRIIVCSPGYKNKFAGFYYAFDKKILNGLIRAGHNVIHFRDREESRIAHTKVLAIGKTRANLSLIEIAEHFRPEMIALFHADVVTNETLTTLRAAHPGCLVVNVDCDALVDGHVMTRMRARGPVCDLSFVTTAGPSLATLRAAGVPARYIPNPTDASMEDVDAYAADEKNADLVYMSSYARKAAQWRFLDAVVAAAPELTIVRYGIDKQRLLGRAYFEALKRARAALNWGKYNDVPLYSSDRIGQLFGAGVCVAMPRGSGFGRFLGEDDALFFDGAEDLAARLRRAIADESWRAIGRAGQTRYRTLFNERRIAEFLVAAATGGDVTGYEWADL